MPIECRNGQRFRQIVIPGADWVRLTREHLNRINVFSLPDGDTGTMKWGRNRDVLKWGQSGYVCGAE